MSNSYFVSDLHMFARRSEPDRHTETIRNAARDASTLVLGGDIFDFRWTTLDSKQDTVQAAIEWLDELVCFNPDCQFEFVLGNHDYHAPFIERLAELSEQRENLGWHRYYFRSEQCVFLHGDVAERAMTQAELTAAREHWLYDETEPGRFKHWLYDRILETPVIRMSGPLVFPNRRVAKRIRAYLEDVGEAPENGVRHVYYGHTHKPVAHYKHDGLTFHNGGAPIKGLKFRIVKTELGAERQ